jgi:hypothetical protein
MLDLSKRLASKLLGPALYGALTEFYRNEKQWYLTPEYRHTRQQLKSLKDKHIGQRCFIIGNGPSLNRTNLSALVGEYTFGLNRIYLLFERTGFIPSYYVCMNPYVIEQSWSAILGIPSPKFISFVGARYLPQRPDIIFLRPFFRPPHFSYNLAQGLWEGATVTFCALQIAYHLGFNEVILVGVDHYFTTQGEPNTLVVSRGDDLNHFDPNYFGPDTKWQLPDLHTSEIAYRMAKNVFEQAGRRIIDATVDGQLQIFPKVSFEEIVANSR